MPWSAAAARSEVERAIAPTVHLRRLGRQVRRCGAQRPAARRDTRDERADRVHGPASARRNIRCSVSCRWWRRPSRWATRTVVVPSELYPLAATDFYQVLETSDVPDGVVNIVTGSRTALAKTLAEHDEVDGLWYFGPREVAAAVERCAGRQHEAHLGRMDTRVTGRAPAQGEGREFLRHATQVKNIWIPYGE